MTAVNLETPSLYINRELSQVEFNRRVLHECYSEDHPLLERAKFLAIFSSNMDEFFMVRVSGLKQQMRLHIIERPADGLTPREQLLAIHRTVTRLFAEAMECWQDLLRPQLEAANIHILNYSQIKKSHQKRLRDYFEQEIFLS